MQLPMSPDGSCDLPASHTVRGLESKAMARLTKEGEVDQGEQVEKQEPKELPCSITPAVECTPA